MAAKPNFKNCGHYKRKSNTCNPCSRTCSSRQTNRCRMYHSRPEPLRSSYTMNTYRNDIQEVWPKREWLAEMLFCYSRIQTAWRMRFSQRIFIGTCVRIEMNNTTPQIFLKTISATVWKNKKISRYMKVGDSGRTYAYGHNKIKK